MRKLWLWFVLGCLCFCGFKSFASKIVSVKNGNWNSNPTWAAERFPGSSNFSTYEAADTVVISKGTKVIITPMGVSYNGVVQVYGELMISGAANLLMEVGSVIQIAEGGSIRSLYYSSPDNSFVQIGEQLLNGQQIREQVFSPDQITESSIAAGGGCSHSGKCEDNPLPVDLLYFRAISEAGEVKLEWASSRAWSFSHYELERSANGRDFEALAHVEAQKESVKNEYYSYTDRKPLPFFSYYRLKAVDVDGNFEYKGIEGVESGGGFFRVYPNPSSKGYVTIDWPVSSGDLYVRLKDNSGREVRSASLLGQEKEFVTQGLPAGVYFLTIESSAGIKQLKLILH